MSKANGNDRPPLLEWIASGVGLALALAMLGIIGWEVLRGGSAAPAVAVEALQVLETEAGFTVEIRAFNSGDETAGDVLVEGELKRGDETVETGETTFTYIPSRSERRGGMFFSQDPRSYTLELRALGYTAP